MKFFLDIVCNDGKFKMDIATIAGGEIRYKNTEMMKNEADLFDFCKLPSSDQKFRVAYNIWKPFVFKRYHLKLLILSIPARFLGKCWIILALQRLVLKFLTELTFRWQYFCFPFLFPWLQGEQAAWPRAQSDGGVHPLLVVLGPVGRGQAEVDWCSGKGDLNRVTFWMIIRDLVFV